MVLDPLLDVGPSAGSLPRPDRPDILDEIDPSTLPAPDRGLLGELLHNVELPGYAVRNLLQGNFQGAGANFLDFPLVPTGALQQASGLANFLSFGALPELSEFTRPGTDTPSTSDLLDNIGLRPPEGLAEFGVNLVGDTLTNPLSYIGIGTAPAGVKVGGAIARQSANAVRAASVAKRAAAGDDLIRILGQAGTAAGQPAREAARKAVSAAIQSGLTQTGRKALRSGQLALDDLAEQVLTRIDDIDDLAAVGAEDFTRIADEVIDAADSAGTLFGRGGLRLEVPIPFTDIPLSGTLPGTRGVNMDPLSGFGRLLGFGSRRVFEAAEYGLDTVSGAFKDPSIKALADGTRSGIQFVRDRGRRVLEGLRDSAGSALLDPIERTQIDAIQNTSSNAVRAGMEEVAGIVSGLSDGQRKLVTQAIQGVTEAGGDAAGLRPIIDDEAITTFSTLAQDMERATARLQALGVEGDELAALSAAVERTLRLGRTQFKNAVDRGAFRNADIIIPKGGTPDQSIDAAFLVNQFKDELALRGEDVSDFDALIEEVDELRRMLDDPFSDDPASMGAAALGELTDRAVEMQRRLDGLDERAVKQVFNTDRFKKWLSRSGEFADRAGPAYERAKLGSFEGFAPALYAQRLVANAPLEDNIALLSGRPSSLLQRSMRTPLQLAEGLNESNRTLDWDIANSLLKRTEEQSQLLRMGQVGRLLMGDEFVAADATMRKSLNQILDMMVDESRRDGPFSAYLRNTAKNPGQRDMFTQVLANANRIFKGPAVYGFILPRVSGAVRNANGGFWQTLSTADRTLLQRPPREWIETLTGAMADGVRRVWKDAPVRSRMSKMLAVTDEMWSRFGGNLDNINPDAMRGIYREMAKNNKRLRGLKDDDINALALAFQNGIFSDYISADEIMNRLSLELTPGTLAKWTRSSIDVPQAVFQGVESRMRLGAFLHGMENGLDPLRAGQVVADTFLDYRRLGGNVERTLRDIIPFYAFASRNLVQQARLLSSDPALAVAVGQVFGQEDSDTVLPPYLARQVTIPLGIDGANGDPLVITGTGLPIEALDSLPNIFASDPGREIRRGLISQAQPLLRTGFGFISGEDPFFGSEFGSFSRTPTRIPETLLGEGFGQAANVVAGTGLIQPLRSNEALLGQLGRGVSGEPEQLLRAFTGISVDEVDQDRALVRRIDELLESDPDVFEGRFFGGGSPESQELLRLRGLAQEQIARERRAAQAMAQ